MNSCLCFVFLIAGTVFASDLNISSAFSSVATDDPTITDVTDDIVTTTFPTTLTTLTSSTVATNDATLEVHHNDSQTVVPPVVPIIVQEPPPNQGETVVVELGGLLPKNVSRRQVVTSGTSIETVQPLTTFPMGGIGMTNMGGLGGMGFVQTSPFVSVGTPLVSVGGIQTSPFIGTSVGMGSIGMGTQPVVVDTVTVEDTVGQ
jgi:hypothetical protein